MALVALLVLVTSSLGAQKCPEYTKDGCASCTKETWLDGLKHCGFCHDARGPGCMDGSESGPFDGSCANWEWYGSGGAPGGKCCGDETDCVTCLPAAAGCAWCTEQAVCVEKSTTPESFCNRTARCCSSLTTCPACSADSGCGWCASSGQCVASDALGSCAVVADKSCCNVEAACSGCGANKACTWCDAPAHASPYCGVGACQAPAVADTGCCSDRANCTSCNVQAGAGCAWCTTSPQRCTNRNLACGGGGFADGLCCESLSDCSTCQQTPGCAYCLADRTCHRDSALCPNPADSKCCDVQTAGGTCASCVDTAGCSFCTASKQCTDGQCSTLNVGNQTSWQCDNPVLLNCEAQQSCSACVPITGCVWIANVWINGVPQPNGLCFTGGLFGLSSNQVPGFVITTPTGFYWQTCSMTAASILILIGSLVGGVLLIAALVVVLCVCCRRRRRLRSAASSSSMSSTGGFGDSSSHSGTVNVETLPLTAPPPEQQQPKKKKKRVAKPMVYEKPVESVRATNSRYYQARNKK